MAVSSSNTITAGQFNSLQNRVEEVLGTGSGDFGYGQTVLSSNVSPVVDKTIPDGDFITAKQFNDLRLDINKAYQHQTGNTVNVETFSVGDIIGADVSAADIDRNGDTWTFVSEKAENGFNDLLDLATSIENNRLNIDVSQEAVEVKIIDERSNNWNGNIQSVFSVTFANADRRRHFFNAGGQIRVEGSVDMTTSEPNSNLRDAGWSDLLTNPGQIQFGINSTQATGSSVVENIGDRQLTTSYQTVFRKDAGAGVYGESYWTLEAKQQSSTKLTFRISLYDDGPESAGTSPDTPIVEPVSATLDFEYSCQTAGGAVNIPFPAFVLDSPFQ